MREFPVHEATRLDEIEGSVTPWASRGSGREPSGWTLTWRSWGDEVGATKGQSSQQWAAMTQENPGSVMS